MSEPDKVDLSVLSPTMEPEHWDRVMAATLIRVDAVLARRAEVFLVTIAGWTRPLLIAAAALLMLLVPVEVALEKRESGVEQIERLVALSVEWDRGESPPSGAEFVRALSAEDIR